MYKPDVKPRINHFILWCKNWYEPVNKEMSILEQCKQILKLDEYLYVKTYGDVIHIITSFIDDYNEYLISINKKPFRHERIISEIHKHMQLYDMNFYDATILVYKEILAFDIKASMITLEPPVYNRKLYKLGFVYSCKKIGQTYKECNKMVEKLFIHNKKRTS